MNILQRIPAALFALAALLFGSSTLAAAAPESARKPESITIPPKPMREFRGAWVATVSNMDWPSKPGLSVAAQKAELIDILNRAQKLRLNAVIFQVRPSCDALYVSKLEPWSEYLTGQMGKAPSPAYDPLAFAIEEAHRRGLELHAWFNPFRARMPGAKSDIAASHVMKARPDWVRIYGEQRWLDPSEPAVQQHSLAVILDVVRRYDIDAVHLDDYFYPYKEKDKANNPIDFPDERNWRQYQAAGGRLSRSDWRRKQVNDFVQTLQARIRAEKPLVRFGISPFGIWRPGFPKQITGLDAYEQLYADARLWFQNGWVDYFTPQLYWAIKPPAQSYPVLLAWWAEQNEKKRHLWAGNYSGRVPAAWQPQEIVQQVHLTRRQPGASGNVFFNMTSLKQKGLADALGKLYWQPALVPASTWLDSQPPAPPKASWAHATFSKPRIRWEKAGAEPAALWVLQLRTEGKWTTEIVPGTELSRAIPHSIARKTDLAAVSAVDRCGNLSAPVVIRTK